MRRVLPSTFDLACITVASVAYMFLTSFVLKAALWAALAFAFAKEHE